MTLEFPVLPWADIVGFYERIADRGGVWISPMLRIAQSVIAEGATDDLMAHTSMHDLVVTVPPRRLQAETDYVRVALLAQERGVRIWHRPIVGASDDLSRPADEAVALFWRFMIEKYGIHPARDWI